MARPGLRLHPKFRRLVHLLNVPEPHAWGYLECLWDVAYAHGCAIIGDARAVLLCTQFPGESEAIVSALVESRFLDALPDGTYAVHDLEENAPEYIRARIRKRRERARKKGGGDAAPSRDSDGLSRDSHGTVTSPHTPLRAEQSRAEPRDESLEPSCSEPAKPASEPTATDQPLAEPALPLTDKHPRPGRGDAEKSQRDRGGEACAPQTPDPAAAPDSPDDPVVLAFPVVGGKRGQGPTEWPLRRSKLAEYQESFPHLDVLAECRKALQWCRDTPAKRKTLRGMPAFLARWLARAQDSGRGLSRFGAAGNGQLDFSGQRDFVQRGKGTSAHDAS